MIAGTPPRATPAAARRSRGIDLRADLPGDPRADAGDRRRARTRRSRPSTASAIAAAIPGARFELLDPGAHLASVERADAVTTLIADHSTGTRGAMSDERHDAGMKVRREVLGDEHVDRAIERTTDFTEPFQEFITRYAWGEVWTRDGPGPPHAQRDHAGRADRAAAARTRSRCTCAPRCATA